jgi:hypothetical protein
MKKISIILLFISILSSCVQKSYEQTVTLFLDVSQLSDIKTVGVRGEHAPLNWDKDLEMKAIKKDSLYSVTLSGKTGYKFESIKFVVNGEFELKEKPNRKVYFDESKKTIYRAKFNVE